MEPEQYGPNQQPAPPGIYNQAPPDMSAPGPASFDQPGNSNSNRKLIIAGALIGLLTLIIIILIVLLATGDKAPAPAKETTSETSQSQGPQPASAIDIEQTNNAISQDISGLNDDQDFPADKLNDKNLKL